MKNKNIPNFERKIAKTKAELPILKAGYARFIHFTRQEFVESILKIGLDYSSEGMLQSIARGWSKSEEVDFTNNDPRYQGDSFVAIVFDLNFSETKLHNDIQKAPGIIPADCIIGIIPNTKKD